MGILGLGKMGSALVEGFLKAEAVSEEFICIYDIDPQKTKKLQKRWPQISIANNEQQLARQVELLFLVIEPADVFDILQKIKSELAANTHLISVSAGVTLSNLQSVVPNMISKIIPAIVFKNQAGVTLLAHNDQVSYSAALYLEELLKKVCALRIIDEKDFEAMGNLSSVAPALFSYLMMEYARLGAKYAQIDLQEAAAILRETMLATALTLEKDQLSFEEMINAVATEGGITQTGISDLQQEFPALAARFFKVTLAKHEATKRKIEQMFAKT